MITLAEVDTVLRSVQPILAGTLYPAAALSALVFGSEAHRLGADTQHDLSDYFPPETETPPVRERLRLRRTETPIHDGLAARPYVPLDDDAVRSIARQWLEDIAAVEQAKAGIRPTCAHWPNGDGICWSWSDCARDMTGASPVVAVTA